MKFLLNIKFDNISIILWQINLGREFREIVVINESDVFEGEFGSDSLEIPCYNTTGLCVLLSNCFLKEDELLSDFYTKGLRYVR